MSKPTTDPRALAPERRATTEEIDAMPALITTKELSFITGNTEVYTAKLCKDGIFKDIAVKCGRSWRVNKAMALQILKLA